MQAILLLCGVVSSLLYVATDILGGQRFPYTFLLWVVVLAIARLLRPSVDDEAQYSEAS